MAENQQAEKIDKKYRIKRNIRITLKWTAIAVLIIMVQSVELVFMLRFVNPPMTPLMISRAIDQKNAGKSVKIQKKWVPLEQVSECMIQAVVASEDNNFTKHRGFDFVAIKDAYEENAKGRRLRGASTITQQTCKNVFLWEGRSYTRKAAEVWFTFWVETLWSKHRIMEVYLNVIEMGNGIYGVGAAAEVYYHKPPLKLSCPEAAMIAAVLPSPLKRNPVKPTPYLFQRQSQILDLMDKIGKVEL